MSGPLLSVVLASRDRYLLLRHAVASVLSQAFDLELVICDDDSQDPRVRGFLDAVGRHPAVVVRRGGPVSAEHRAGHEMVAEMVNAGLDAARGRYISLLCDDDAYLPGRCAAMAGFLDGNPDVDVAVGMNWWLDERSRRLPHETLRSYAYRPPFEPGHEELVKQLGPPVNYICHDSVMFRRTDVRWGSERTHTPVDWRFWCSLRRRGSVFRRTGLYGEEAYFPGLWARADPERVAAARGLGGFEMEKVRMAVNVSGKRQKIRNGRSTRLLTVHNGERIEASRVEIVRPGRAPRLPPGFEYCGEVSFHEVKIPAVAEPRRAAEVEGPLLTEGPDDAPEKVDRKSVV